VLCRQTASFSPAALDAPRPATGVRRMPHRGPNNEAPATALSPCVDQDDQRLEAAVLFTGWDWASASHAVTILDSAGEVVDRWVFAPTEQDLDTMLARLASHGSPAELPVAIERADAWWSTGCSPPATRWSRSTLGHFMPPGPGGVPPGPRPTRVTATSSRTTCAPTATGCAGWSRWTRLPAGCKRWSGCAMTMLWPRPRPGTNSARSWTLTGPAPSSCSSGSPPRSPWPSGRVPHPTGRRPARPDRAGRVLPPPHLPRRPPPGRALGAAPVGPAAAGRA
jgi:hypothetical protein